MSEESGGCSCGKIRFAVTGEPLWVAHCHCRDCRGSTSSAFATYAGFKKQGVTWSGDQPTGFASTPGAKRAFCGSCGTPLYFVSDRWPEEIHLFVAAFDAPEQFTPQAHVYAGERLPWVHLDDGLPEFEKTPSGK